LTLASNSRLIPEQKRVKMVKKRVRDPEVLPEAPTIPSNGEDEGSGSDEVCSSLALSHVQTTY
jgi:hypothetical protein